MSTSEIAQSRGASGEPQRKNREAAWAKIAITVLFLALVRNLGEVFRLRYVHGSAATLDHVLPYVAGGMVTAVLGWVAVTLFFFARYRLTVAVAALTVAVLVALKIVLVGDG